STQGYSSAASDFYKRQLYAGTVAKYSSYIITTGEATTKGLMGMNIADAPEFFRYAIDACKMLENAGFSLHDGADKEKAFVEVFTTECPEEDIFVKQYTDRVDAIWDTSLFHCWDVMTLPTGTGLSSAVGCAIQPTWELMSLYEHPALVDENGKPVRFDNITDFWNTDKMEPRARATFFFSGMTEPLSKVTIDLLRGAYTSYPGTAEDGTPELPNAINEYTDQYRILAKSGGEQYQEINGQRIKISGLHSNNNDGDEGFGYMGAFIRKYVSTTDAAARQDLMYGKTSFKVFRYGEVLCNWAEAAYELGDLTSDENLKKEAFDKVNELRRRAGAHEHAYDPAAMDIGTAKYGFKVDENLQYIRDERTRELAFENHRIFDFRRWRVADEDYRDGKYSHTLSAYYVIDEGKYIFLNEVDRLGRRVNFYK
ncbi:MAG: RagB/SusD family nutrient uptake outer membrane protein, partial [Duncaniella sp.]|nr:RagB/SusD family nutrient uptake outer membrane protein [Duncaniella sp.]